MTIATLSDFRGNIKSYFDKIINNFETLIISRGKNKGIVMMSLEKYNAMQETMYLLDNKKNATRLFDAIERSNNGQVEIHDLIED